MRQLQHDYVNGLPEVVYFKSYAVPLRLCLDEALLRIVVILYRVR